MSVKGILAQLRTHYEKLLASGALLALLGSLLYLGVHVGMIGSIEHDFEKDLENTPILHQEAAKPDLTPAQDALRRLADPHQLARWTNRFLVAELRVWCVDCRRPIPYDAMTCPFCLADQPKPAHIDEERDTDKDGIPDLKENEVGLDRLDPSDAQRDKDGDLFSNIIEYREGTDLNDPDSYPPLEKLLAVTAIRASPFRLKFRSVTTLPDKSKKFFINFDVRGRTWTESARLGDEIEGYTLHKYEVREEMRKTPGHSKPVKTDVHVLVLNKGEQLVPLEKGTDVRRDEYTAELIFTLDDSRHRAKVKEEFALKDLTYRVIAIDNTKGDVVIERLKDSERFVVSRGK